MKLKQKLASSIKKGWTMMELIFVIVVMGLGIAAVVQIGTNAMQDSEIDSAIGKSTQSIVGGLPKYKFEYQGSNGWYAGLKSDTIKTFVRPLVADATLATLLYPNGYSNIKFTFGEDATNKAGWVCMDASGKYPISNASELSSNASTLLAAQQKFVSNIKKLSSNIKVTQLDGGSALADGADTDTSAWNLATLATAGAANAKAIVCAGNIK